MEGGGRGRTIIEEGGRCQMDGKGEGEQVQTLVIDHNQTLLIKAHYYGGGECKIKKAERESNNEWGQRGS